MKKINKSSLSALLIIFGFFVMTLNFWDNPATSQPIFTEDGETNESLPNTSQFIPRTIRVAIYNEPDTTLPSYGTGGGYNNLTDTIAILNSAGYQLTNLTTNDILDHKLITADYDVFVMVDNLPKDSITNYVKEFWLGGGGLLSFDTAICFLCYTGILPPISIGDNGNPPYWDYFFGTHEIYQRHPVTKHYSAGNTFTSLETFATFDWAQLQTTSIASDLVRLATRTGDSNDVTVLGFDPSNGGGRVVQVPWPNGEIPNNITDLVIDAVDWLCPRPKGRILFDLSHLPYYGIDSWDITYADYAPRYEIWRDNLVNRSYTLDKFYLGNYTTANLAPYDVLIITAPGINFTSSEVSAVQSWVSNGGSLLALGIRDQGGIFGDMAENINYLLTNIDLKIAPLSSGTAVVDYIVDHPTVEGCTELDASYSAPGLINYSGNAYPIWGNDASNIIIGAQDYGLGRVILSGDFFFLRDPHIPNQDNLQYGINMINWLTASQAKVLIYVEDYPGSDPNDNIYKGPVATALNDLGINFYLTFSGQYLNLSLAEKTWSLTIVESNNVGIQQYFNDIINYLKNGGRLIIRSWQTYIFTTDPLWQYLGYTPNGTRITSSPPEINIWNPTHPIFNYPVSYDANNLTTSLNPFNTDFCYVALHNNATAIAGLGTTVNSTKGAIILSVNGRAISNTMALTEYYDDTDDSTYPDALEIWENEIAFMLYQSLSVGINSPHTSDIFNATSPDFIISTAGMFLDDTWYTLNSGAEYHIASTSGTLNPGAWDSLPDGAVSLRFYVEDSIGNQKYTSVNIVKDSQAPNITITSPSAGDTFGATALSFIVEIIDEHLDKMWYTINSGSTKYFFTANGSIDQSAWDALADGSITIRFYANDTVSNEAFATVSVEISTGGNGGPGGIPGYNSYILIGVIFVISAIIVKRQLKQNKFKN